MCSSISIQETCKAADNGGCVPSNSAKRSRESFSSDEEGNNQRKVNIAENEVKRTRIPHSTNQDSILVVDDVVNSIEKSKRFKEKRRRLQKFIESSDEDISEERKNNGSSEDFDDEELNAICDQVSLRKLLSGTFHYESHCLRGVCPFVVSSV